MKDTKNTHYLIFDESGNLGNRGRYFVIACIDTYDWKPLHNMMRRKLGIAKKMFQELSALHSNEIKAKDAYPCIKFHLLECIAGKDIHISYIVADLCHIRTNLLNDKNILYNYLMRLLIERVVTPEDDAVHMICDNHTTKVASANSFSDYIKLFLVYEKEYDMQINVKYLDSDSKEAYIVQAADYVANAVYGYYEYGDKVYYNQFAHKVKHQLLFPWRLFGK
ncbi:MAG: DUF3800 domain-containing protein [Roseburia sp.]|nr:DUF3800 domain-containing protein [Roseburia sp.]